MLNSSHTDFKKKTGVPDLQFGVHVRKSVTLPTSKSDLAKVRFQISNPDAMLKNTWL